MVAATDYMTRSEAKLIAAALAGKYLCDCKFCHGLASVIVNTDTEALVDHLLRIGVDAAANA